MIAMFLTLLTLLMGCESTPECVVNTDCGQGEACISDECTAVECMTSAVCTLGQYCELESYTCQLGCGTDRDCWAGQSCVLGECQVPECTNSQRDCSVGEICQNGGCNDDGGSCERCSGGTCPAGFECWGGTYCLKTCVTQSDCPAAFTCVEDVGYCYNDCAWLKTQGYP